MANATQQPKSAATQAAPVTATAFRAQTQPTIKRPGVNIGAAIVSGSTTPLQDTQIPPTTLLRCIYIEVTATTSGNTSEAVAFEPDAPANVFSVVNFHDAQGTSIVGPFDSFTLSMAQKYFGFVNNSDPMFSAVTSITTSNSSSEIAKAGSFTIVFRIPVEVVSRTGIGSQINTDTQSPLVLSLTLNEGSAIYSTAPTNLPTVAVVISYGGYWNQSGNPNSFATPTAVGTLNYINWTNYQSVNSTQQFQLSNIGLGNSVANILFINRDTSSGNRSDSDFANPLQIAYRGNVLVQLSQLLWKHLMSEAYDFLGSPGASSNVDTYNQDGNLGLGISGVLANTPGLNQGVYNIWFNQDFTNVPGASLFYGLLNTAVGDSIELTGTWGGSSTLYEVINFLAVSGSVTTIQGH